jgi:hypothetical protein
MNEDVFNVSLRRFLKKVGITSQREIEQAVREALADGRIKANWGSCRPQLAAPPILSPIAITSTAPAA